MGARIALALTLPGLVSLVFRFCCGLPGYAAWTPETYPDPSEAISQCRASGLGGRICDPDRILGSIASQAAESILKDVSQATHPFSKVIVEGWIPCRGFGNQGFEVGVWLLLGFAHSALRSWVVYGQPVPKALFVTLQVRVALMQKMDLQGQSAEDAAANFTSQLHEEWRFRDNQCDGGTILLLATHDRQARTSVRLDPCMSQ